MNKSFQHMQSSTSHYLPRIKPSQSTRISSIQNTSVKSARYKSHSVQELSSNPPLTRKLVNMEQLKKVEEYDSMNEKELLREHEKLLRIIKKFQEIIEIHLSRKKKEKAKSHNKSQKPTSTREELLKSEVANNKKIIENYQRQIKELQGTKKQRKLNDVIEEKLAVEREIVQLKKDIFNLKNDDNMAGRSLVENRPAIEKEIREIEKDLKIQLTKKHEYIKKTSDLTEQLKSLKKDCQGLDVKQMSKQKSNSENLLMKLAMKNAELKQIQSQRTHLERTIQDNMVSKAKRNKALEKEIQSQERRMAEINNRLQQFKEKIERYQKAMNIFKPAQTSEVQAS